MLCRTGNEVTSLVTSLLGASFASFMLRSLTLILTYSCWRLDGDLARKDTIAIRWSYDTGITPRCELPTHSSIERTHFVNSIKCINLNVNRAAFHQNNEHAENEQGQPLELSRSSIVFAVFSYLSMVFEPPTPL